MKMTKTTSKFRLAVYLENRKIVGFGINDTQRRLSAYPPNMTSRGGHGGVNYPGVYGYGSPKPFRAGLWL